MALLSSRRRWLWLLGIALVVVATVIGQVRMNVTSTTHVGSLSIVSEAYAFDSGVGDIGEASARAAAAKSLASMRPDLSHPALRAAQRIAALREVRDSRGQLVFSNLRAVNAWVFQISAPAQQGFAHVEGAIVLNASDGSTVAMSVYMWN